MFGPNKDSGDDSAVCAFCPILSPHTALSKIIKIISVSIQCLFGEDTIARVQLHQEMIWKVMVMIVSVMMTMAARDYQLTRMSSDPGSAF